MSDNRELFFNENEFDNSLSIYTLASLIQTSTMSTMENSELSSNISLDSPEKVANTTGVGKVFKKFTLCVCSLTLFEISNQITKSYTYFVYISTSVIFNNLSVMYPTLKEPDTAVFTVASIYLVCFVVGICGNASTLTVIFGLGNPSTNRRKSSLSTATSTGDCFRIYVAALCIVDTLVLLSLPWGRFLCSLIPFD